MRQPRRRVGVGRLLAAAGLAVAGLLLLGLVQFAAVATRDADPAIGKADGIVALTGGESRLAEAGRLLRDGHARRMLVTGVNRLTTRDEVLHLAGLAGHDLACCVDLGYEARDTTGNAEETQAWVNAHSFRRLIVVTASYHMPRSLAELGRVLPDVELIAHPVVPRSLQSEPWWLHPTSARIIVFEYAKFLPSAARYVLSLAWGPSEQRSMHAAVPGPQ